MITQLHLENFKGHLDTRLSLPRFAILVGDNGSGKTSVLEALRFPGEHIEQIPGDELDELLRRSAHRIGLGFEGQGRQRWTGSIDLDSQSPHGWNMIIKGQSAEVGFQSNDGITAEYSQHAYALQQLSKLMGPIRLYRFRADQVAAVAYSAQSQTVVAEDGAQTAVVLADLKLADDERFNRIENALRKIVPSFQRLRIGPAMIEVPHSSQPVRGSRLHLDFQGATNVPAHRASHGTLVALALLTVLHGNDRPGVILLDDFDHSLHPRAQMELVRMIKDLLELDEFRDTQVIATTHSPYVLDEVSPSNVIAFALREDGTVASKPLSEHPDAAKVTGALKAGELWTLDAERDWVR
ncbi:MAG TPA: AAA family ATPase [Kofleriaceae bacterium]|nr:AAA family ATPase [Kofleriaceae bacterium]